MVVHICVFDETSYLELMAFVEFLGVTIFAEWVFASLVVVAPI